MAFATPLEGKSIHGESTAIALDILFDHDDLKALPNGQIKETPTLDEVTLNFYGDIVDLSDSELRASLTGQHFRISNSELGILIYAYYNDGPQTYRTNLYFINDGTFEKYSISTEFKISDDIVITDGVIGDDSPSISGKDYVPRMDIAYTVKNTYHAQSDFTVDIRVFDDKIENYGSLENTKGSLEGVDITVEIQQEDTYRKNVIADVFVTEIIKDQ